MKKTIFLMAAFAATALSCSSPQKNETHQESTPKGDTSVCTITDTTTQAEAPVSITLTDFLSGPFALGELPAEGRNIHLEHKFFVKHKTIETQTEEGVIYEPIAEVYFNGEVIAIFKQGEAVVLSPKITGENGFRVGATVEECLKNEPGAKIFYTYISGTAWVELPGNWMQQFIISTSDINPDAIANPTSDMTPINPKDVKPEAKIMQIRVIKPQ